MEEDIDIFIDAVIRKSKKKRAQFLEFLKQQVEQFAAYNKGGKRRCATRLTYENDVNCEEYIREDAFIRRINRFR